MPATSPRLSPAAHRAAFTMVEVLVTVAIIALLLALVLGALSVVRAQQRKASTMKLMQNLGTAITAYLDRYPLLNTDFNNRYLTYLTGSAAGPGGDPAQTIVEIPNSISTWRQATPGVWERAAGAQAEAACDAWASDPNRLLIVTVDNVSVPNRPGYTRTVILRSKGPVMGDDTDDIVYMLTLDANYVRANPATYNLTGWNLTRLESRVFDYVTR